MAANQPKTYRIEALLVFGLFLSLVISSVLFVISIVLTYGNPSIITRDRIAPLLPALESVVKDAQNASLPDDLIGLRKDIGKLRIDIDKSNLARSDIDQISADLDFLSANSTVRTARAQVNLVEAQSRIANLKKLTETLNSPPDGNIMFVVRRVKGLLEIAATWPFVVLLVLLYLVISKVTPQRVADYLKPFQSIELFGAKVALTEQTKSDAEAAIGDYRKLVKRQFDNVRQKSGIAMRQQKVFVNAVSAHIRQNTASEPLEIRCTIHVPDILFADTLYQFTDYYPNGGGSGRAFPTRFGIIGKAWRLQKAEAAGEVPTDATSLIANWGMTSEEADSAAQGRQSFCAVVIVDDSDSPLGVFYVDAKNKDAFGPSEHYHTLYDNIQQACKTFGVTNALLEMRNELSGQAPIIQIYG